MIPELVILLAPVLIIMGAVAVACGVGWGVAAFLKWLAGPRPCDHEAHDAEAAGPEGNDTVTDLPAISGGRDYVDFTRPGRSRHGGGAA